MYLPQDAEDAALVERCLGGETAAFEVLVERYQRTLFTVAARMLGSREDAADATQNALVRAFENLRSFDPERRFFSWIYRIAVNECLNVLRARRPQDDVDGEPSRTTHGVFERLAAHERRDAVLRAVLRLPADLRAVIVLRHFAGLSYEEIALALRVPEKTIKSRLYTARQRLGQQLLGWSGDQ